MSLRSHVIRLAHTVPSLRPHLLPLLASETGGKVAVSSHPIEATLDFLANGWEHGDHASAVRHLTRVLGNADAANDIMDAWAEERPDLKARGNLVLEQMLMENLVGQFLNKHHVR